MKSAGAVLIMAAATCKVGGTSEHTKGSRDPTDLGLIPIGSPLISTNLFVSTDCIPSDATRMADCTGIDSLGRKYAFFAGRLAKISADSTSSKKLRLPADVEIGSNIHEAASRIEKYYKVKMQETLLHDGRIVINTDYVIKSKRKIFYSIELISTPDGKLDQFVQRTDF